MPIYAFNGHIPTYDDVKTNWIAPDATVVGQIHLGENVSLWFGVVLRGDNELIKIGSNTNVQEHCIMHTDYGFPLTIGEGCTIGHRAMLHGCSIGDNSLIGIGAIILNGAKIGNNCLIGAGALVTERKEFPDNSLIVGSPARVVRQLDDAAVERLKESARNYVAKSHAFMHAMVPV